ncbi:hypothetical protein HDV57DRAFT_419974 [Trichoderma longibrachiatum]|uniref:Cora-domain-containing protein n=1 Tax=Trichoderma longibrachiatum ATCC 18648 TaxID=983965 RepID=A0A2T4C323_TRILO|nr:hypothetical protein M440DRAFT_1402493 [Trichoderma longibrachiatum ATCC 18648]
MSWTKRSQEVLYRDFTEKAAAEPSVTAEKPWSLEVYDISQDGQLREYVQNTVRRLNGNPRLRIVFAPSDTPRRETKGLMVELFHKFGIPHDFTAERARSTNHSLSRRSSDDDGFSSWFRFSCISSLFEEEDESPSGKDNATAGAPLPDKYPLKETAFFLQASKGTNVTLVCFGAGLGVRRRFKDLIRSREWNDIDVHPEILFDIALEGLFEEVDDVAWRLEEEFAPLEQSINQSTDSEAMTSSFSQTLSDTYAFMRHTAELSRALESVLMINEGLIISTSASITSSCAPSSSDANRSRPSLVALQLKECLEYRRTLFRSTQLRLSALQKRTEAVIAVSSNLVLQQQSAAVIQGPVSMKLIAASILIFLPTITVATIAGSRLLLSEQRDEEGSWDVSATPLFYMLWYISIPLTLAVIVLSFCWLWWRQGRSKKKTVLPSPWYRKRIWRRATGNEKHQESNVSPV